MLSSSLVVVIVASRKVVGKREVEIVYEIDREVRCSQIVYLLEVFPRAKYEDRGERGCLFLRITV